MLNKVTESVWLAEGVSRLLRTERQATETSAISTFLFGQHRETLSPLAYLAKGRRARLTASRSA